MTSQDAEVDVTVVVATYDRSRYLPRLMDSLVSQQVHDQFRYEIVVVDNNSNDETAGIIRQYQRTASNVAVKYVFEARQGLSYARNAGVKHASGKYIAFIDDDAYAEPQWLYELWTAITTQPGVVCVGGRTKLWWEEQEPPWMDVRLTYLLGQCGKGDEPRLLKANRMPCGGNSLYVKSLFLRCGGLAPDLGRSGLRLMAYEEIDLLLRMQATGGYMAYAPRAVIHHHVPRERAVESALIERAHWNGYSEALVLCKHGKVIRLVSDIIKRWALITYSAIFWVFSRDPISRTRHRVCIRCQMARANGIISGLRRLDTKR